jgi:class 3 adenylate cyclase/tetratricopeptide (TPR) repeat protein
MDVERVRSLLNAYFSAMSATIDSWGGTVEKFIGDAILAYFGVPRVREDDAERAVRAALQMLGQLIELNEVIRRQHGVELSIRIGINTGEVIVPVGGAPDDVVGGDVNNVAARLQELASANSILVGRRTFAAVGRAFEFGPKAELELKGKQQRVVAFPLLGMLGDTPRRPLRLQSAMVGRDRELAALGVALDGVFASRRAAFITVYGPAGMGKSRLVKEFLTVATVSRPGVRVLRGRCAATTHGVAYLALGEVVRDATGITISDSTPVAVEKLETSVRNLLAPLQVGADEVRKVVQALALTAGVDLPGNPLPSERPYALAHVLARAWARFAEAAAADGGAILVIEDLHWSSESMNQLLERMSARVMAPLLIVGTSRPETGSSPARLLQGREGISVLSLDALTDDETSRLVEGLLAGRALPGEAHGLVVNKAEGNPFFVEELLRRAIDQGADPATEGSVLQLPDTVHAVLAARIDGLSEAQRRVLQEAAVMGRTFWEEPIRRAMPDQPVADILLELEDAALVVGRPGSMFAGEIEFAFRHALVRDVAYATVPRVRRGRAHALVGAWLEEIAGESLDEVIQLVAYHYDSAVAGTDAGLAWVDEPETYERLRGKAFERLLEAGAAARLSLSITRAVELHQRALELASNDRARAIALEALGDDHEAIFHGDEAVAAWEDALSILRLDADCDQDRANICLKAVVMAVKRWGGFRNPVGGAVVDRFIEEGLAATSDRSTRAQLLALRAQAAGRWALVGKPDPVPVAERRLAAEEAVGLAAELGARYEVDALLGMEAIALVEGSYDDAVRYALSSVEKAERIHHGREPALGHVIAALVVSNLNGAFDQALAHGRASYELARALAPHDQMHATFVLLDALYNLGRWEEMDPFLAEHLERYVGIETKMSCPYVRGGPLIGAVMLAHRGRASDARLFADRVDSNTPLGLAEAFRARLAIVLGEADSAAALLEPLLAQGRRLHAEEFPLEAVVMVEALEALQEWDRLREFLPRARADFGMLAITEPTCARAEGLATAAAGDRAEAERLLVKSLREFERLGMRLAVAETQEALARVRPDGGEELLGQALATYRALGAEVRAARLRDSHADLKAPPERNSS